MPRITLALCIGLVALIIIGNSGCNPPPKGAAATKPVKGTVTLDSKPMPDGEIRFETPGFPGVGLEIKDGSFSGNAPEGKCKVTISKFEKVAAVQGQPEPPPKNSIPAKWNLESKLEATVGASGNEFKFDITSK